MLVLLPTCWTIDADGRLFSLSRGARQRPITQMVGSLPRSVGHLRDDQWWADLPATGVSWWRGTREEGEM